MTLQIYTTTKERLQNGLTCRGGDKCGGDVAFRQNSLATCLFTHKHGTAPSFSLSNSTRLATCELLREYFDDTYN